MRCNLFVTWRGGVPAGYVSSMWSLPRLGRGHGHLLGIRPGQLGTGSGGCRSDCDLTPPIRCGTCIRCSSAAAAGTATSLGVTRCPRRSPGRHRRFPKAASSCSHGQTVGHRSHQACFQVDGSRPRHTCWTTLHHLCLPLLFARCAREGAVCMALYMQHLTSCLGVVQAGSSGGLPLQAPWAVVASDSACLEH